MKLFLTCLTLVFSAASVPILQAQELTETTTDFLGYYLRPGHSTAYQTLVRDNSAKVVNLQSDSSFFVVWVPQNYSSLKDKRIMVCIHGTAGTGYVEARDELNNAKANNYLVIGIQWVLFDAQNRETYFPESKVYKVIDAALKHVKAKYGAEVNKTACKGFSRGGLINYEVSYLDRMNATNYFALTMSLSGGQSPSLTPGKYDRTTFMDNLEHGKYGSTPFAGASFFLYCGLKDEQWDTLQAKYMRYTDSTIRKYAASVTRVVIDPEGKHAGYLTNTGAQVSAITSFLALTSTPTPPTPLQPDNKAINQPLSQTLRWSTNATAALFDVHIALEPNFVTTFMRDSLISASTPSKIVGGVSPNTTLYWRVRSKNNIGTSPWSDVRSFTTQAMTGVANDETDNSIGLKLRISPNPAQDFVNVYFTLLKPERVSLKIFNTLGQEVAQILDATLLAGEHSFPLSLRSYSSSLFFLRLQTSSFAHTQAIQVLR